MRNYAFIAVALTKSDTRDGALVGTVRLGGVVEIRRRRQADWNMASTSYDEDENVKAEVTWSRRLFGKQGWRVIDVTNNSVEETAARILDLMGLRGNAAT